MIQILCQCSDYPVLNTCIIHIRKRYVPNTTKQCRLWDGRQQKIFIGSNVRFNENGFGNRRPEDPKMLEDVSEDQTDQLSTLAAPRARPVVETLPRGAATPLQMPATSSPASGQTSQHSEEATESVADSPLTSLSPSPQYLDSMTPTLPRSEAGYEDTIMLAPPAGANIVTGEPARAVSALAMTSRAFAARSYNEP